MAILRLSTAARNAAATAVAVTQMALGAGTAVLQIRSGAQPATPDTAASGTLLAHVNLPNPAFGSPATGVSLLLGVPLTAIFDAGGTAGHFRILNRNGDAVMDGDITLTGGGGSLTLSNLTIASGVDVVITGTSYTQPLG